MLVNHNAKKDGFTLIELLVVIAIISLISSFSLVSFNNAKARARDAKRMATFYTLRNALQLYYNDIGNGNYPPNKPLGTVSACSVFKDAPCLNELVTSGFLRELPSPLLMGVAGRPYLYFNYTNFCGTPGNNFAVLKVDLETKRSTEISGNCTFGCGTGWCDDAAAPNHYCICLPR